MKKSLIQLLGTFVTLSSLYFHALNATSTIKIYSNNNSFQNITSVMERFNIPFELADSISNSDNLYIIFDVLTIEERKLPKYYIAYQPQDLTVKSLQGEDFRKLSNAIAVWDFSYENIYKYNTKIHNYIYFPNNYEYIDPAILSCLLPLNTLQAYKELLVYSNKNNTDISSHLPTIFYHAVTQNPKIIVEAGVSLGESTHAFRKALEFCQAQLFGIDTDPNCAQAYKNIKNSEFLSMNDLQFADYYLKSPYKDMKLDIVFIDTSHFYRQTLDEIRLFAPLLSERGMLLFHDSNVTPLNNGRAYLRLNNTIGSTNVNNSRGVTHAIKEFLSLDFDESKYLNTFCETNGKIWHVIHYPFCNGLTILQKN